MESLASLRERRAYECRLTPTALLNPICRAETDRMRAEDAGWRRLLDHLARAGPSSPEDLRLEFRGQRPAVPDTTWKPSSCSPCRCCGSPAAHNFLFMLLAE